MLFYARRFIDLIIAAGFTNVDFSQRYLIINWVSDNKEAATRGGFLVG
jgi:hypothetical protein